MFENLLSLLGLLLVIILVIIIARKLRKKPEELSELSKKSWIYIKALEREQAYNGSDGTGNDSQTTY